MNNEVNFFLDREFIKIEAVKKILSSKGMELNIKEIRDWLIEKEELIIDIKEWERLDIRPILANFYTIFEEDRDTMFYLCMDNQYYRYLKEISSSIGNYNHRNIFVKLLDFDKWENNSIETWYVKEIQVYVKNNHTKKYEVGFDNEKAYFSIETSYKSDQIPRRVKDEEYFHKDISIENVGKLFYAKSSFIKQYLDNLDHKSKQIINQDDIFKQDGSIQPYLDTNHPNYSSRLAICIDVWNYLFIDGNYDNNDNIKENISRWNKNTNPELELSESLTKALQSILNFDNGVDRAGKLLKGYIPKVQKN